MAGHTEEPKVYWSKCPDGTARITTLELYALGIEHVPVVQCETGIILELNLNLVDMLQDFYQSCGLNPFSNEVSNLLELPLPQHVRLVYYHLEDGGGMSSLIPHVSRYLPEEYEFLQEFNQHLGTKVAKYWAFRAASELLPELLKLYDLCTTGHDFEYGETGIDPIYGEIPSRCWNFLKGDGWGHYDKKLPHYSM
ncbi:hypothetical protein M422DRAFT_255458 [Sphaerobolus stellatus SS14]|uniref:Uncharacterized protein n=1 Tax=Sphaerobolus stellatus (strain SS14) TaxID=990650 RepID=A0A0C9VTR4_SPHS4|nr:hypothetical protein M422DRAFT_255458 [Sphaerobolus stellatus SS14]